MMDDVVAPFREEVAMVARAAPDITLSLVLYALLSLTVVRMLPVALALIGTGLSRSTVLFMGWFGPRGLASVIAAQATAAFIRRKGAGCEWNSVSIQRADAIKLASDTVVSLMPQAG